MREGRPSFTAALVAFARGMAGVDEVAEKLVPPGFAAALRFDAMLPRWTIRAWNAATLGLVAHQGLRTLVIDRAARAGIANGARQLVILGAGLDARAYRMEGLEDVTVFEVDHPSTQAYKRAQTLTLRPRARELRFVAVDFEKDALDTKLAEAGHRAQEPTFWIWEGVTPYLPKTAILAMLAIVGARSAKGSRIAATYATPEGSALGPTALGVALAGFGAIGEPIRGLITPGEIAAALEGVGFEVLEDIGAEEWGVLASGTMGRWIDLRERLAVGEARCAGHERIVTYG
jgi:methyltransferase (TIGR00027 family)